MKVKFVKTKKGHVNFSNNSVEASLNAYDFDSMYGIIQFYREDCDDVEEEESEYLKKLLVKINNITGMLE